MTALAFLREVFVRASDQPAIVWRDQEFSYRWLLRAIDEWRAYFTAQPEFASGRVVALEADFSPNAVALMLALIETNAIIVPLTSSVEGKKESYRTIAEVQNIVTIDANDDVQRVCTGTTPTHALIRGLVERKRPGLVLFSSGSTGESKAIIHDFVRILDKFRVPRKSKRMITFLLFDHVGGVNTLLYALSNGGCAITLQERAPDAVMAAVERWKAQVLPASPTFLNLVLLSHATDRYDSSSLELVTYGTEVMPEEALRRIAAHLPHVSLQQTYGLSELGILRSKSRGNGSTWVKLGGEGYELRVRDGMLEIKAQSAMLGYLNAPSPFTEDGWMMTNDVVEVDGDWMRILGRRSEIINVGGEKVYPAEVESVLQTMDGVLEVVVRGEPNAITGNMVTALVRIGTGESLREFRSRLREFCRDKLVPYKMPVKVTLVDGPLHGARFKKLR